MVKGRGSLLYTAHTVSGIYAADSDHSALTVIHEQNHDKHGSLVSTGAPAVHMTDDSCSLHWSHMASALYTCDFMCAQLLQKKSSKIHLTPILSCGKVLLQCMKICFYSLQMKECKTSGLFHTKCDENPVFQSVFLWLEMSVPTLATHQRKGKSFNKHIFHKSRLAWVEVFSNRMHFITDLQTIN